MHHVDGLVTTAHLFVVLNGAKEDASQLALAELELAAREVVGNGDGTSGEGDFHNPTLDGLAVFAGNRGVTGSEIHRIGD